MFYSCLKTALTLSGLYKRGNKNALDLGLKRVRLLFDDLPEAFDGYAILFISDLHLDAMDGITQRILCCIRGLNPDLCLLGGDYTTKQGGSLPMATSRMSCLLRRMDARDGIFAVLGNHDCRGMVQLLTRMNVDFLFNTTRYIIKGKQRIRIAGISDPESPGPDGSRLTPDPDNVFTIVVSHRPEFYRDAVRCRSQLYLCGHTHAGQVRLPFLGPMITRCNVPRKMIYGQWTHKNMQGYTTAGAGTSGVPVRFGCRGEVVLLTLGRI